MTKGCAFLFYCSISLLSSDPSAEYLGFSIYYSDASPLLKSDTSFSSSSILILLNLFFLSISVPLADFFKFPPNFDITAFPLKFGTNEVDLRLLGLLIEIRACSEGSTTIFLVKIAFAEEGAGLGAKFYVFSVKMSD